LSQFLAPGALTLEGELERLTFLAERLKKADGTVEKIGVLTQDGWKAPFQVNSLEEELLIKSVQAIGQGVVFSSKRSSKLMETLEAVESFYKEMGGIVGYHQALLQFLSQPKPRFSADISKVHAPWGLDISYPSKEVKESIFHAIDRMDELSEMYPIGGAADRLKLQDTVTGTAMPAALLSFDGSTLLGRLIEDLQAREYLYYKIKGKQITLPVALMTSKEKKNDEHVRALFEKNQWFNRPKDKFAFFSQPLVPVVDKKGNWVLQGPMSPLLKPGGHGVIWKLARDNGVFSWFAKQGVSKSIIRQINNPISSEDYGLLAFSGYGLKENKRFGFASCERQVKASEGINVVVEEKIEGGFSHTLTNIEYCDFKTYSIQDEPVSSSSKYSKFPSNTNLLFVDLPSIEKALKVSPVPGMLVNLKKVSFFTDAGEKKEEEVARLESTMQNIADCFQKESSSQISPENLPSLDTYITFNKRRKTISATKKEMAVGGSSLETPEGCFFDTIRNMRELLEEHCLFSLPKEDEGSFSRPSFIFRYHPSLGPLYSIIGNKVRGGSLSAGSEVHLYVAECDIENLDIAGSFHVVADRVMGDIDEKGILHYSEKVGRCTLKNIKVENLGIDYKKDNVFWKRSIKRRESCRIFLEGASEFYAENMTFKGDFEVHVPDGHKITAKEVGGVVLLEKERLSTPSWRFSYSFTSSKDLKVQKKNTLDYA
jgi:UTP---glucose-1-phosphate uridylyltransferase